VGELELCFLQLIETVKLVGAVAIEPTTLNSNALPLQGIALCPQPEVPNQTAQTVLPSFTSRDPRDNEPFWSSLRTRPL